MKEAMKEAYLASDPIAIDKEEIIPESTAFMTEEERALHDDIYIKLGKDNIELILKNNKLETFINHLKGRLEVKKKSLVFRLRGGGGRGGMMGAAGGGGDDGGKNGDDIKKLLDKMNELEITHKNNEGTITGLEAENKYLKTENQYLQMRLAQIRKACECPITQELPENAVIAEDGYTYNAVTLHQALMYNDRSPVTREKLDSRHLVQNRAINDVVAIFKTPMGSPVVERKTPPPAFFNGKSSFTMSDEEDNQAEEGKGAEEQQESKAAPLPPVPPGDIAPEARV
jgi:hypothetical protein